MNICIGVFFLVCLFVYLFIYLLAALGLYCCMCAFASCGERELFFIEVRGLLTAVASLVAENGLEARRGFSSRGLRAQ